MLRSNIRLILGGLAALALGLAGGWALLAVAVEEPSAPAMQTSAVTRAIATDSREPSPAVAAPSPNSEPSAPAAKLEPASPTPTPIRVVEPVSSGANCGGHRRNPASRSGANRWQAHQGFYAGEREAARAAAR